MKIKFFLLFALACTAATAQITIGRSDMPTANDTVRMSIALPLNLGNRLVDTGANRSWNFNDLQPQSQELVKYQSGLTTAYFLYYANSFGTKIADSLPLGPVPIENVFNFFRSTTTKFTAEGLGFQAQGIPLAASYTDEDELYHFPMTYGQLHTTTFRLVATLPTLGELRSQGIRTTRVAGWGTLTTPYGSHPALMVVSEVVSNDTLLIQGNPLALPPRTSMEYKWLTNGKKLPLLEITDGGPLGGGVGQQIRYRDSYRGSVNQVSVQGLELEKLRVWPNPASDVVQLEGWENARYRIVDLAGRTVQTGEVVDQRIALALAAGNYVLLVETAERYGLHRLVVQP